MRPNQLDWTAVSLVEQVRPNIDGSTQQCITRCGTPETRSYVNDIRCERTMFVIPLRLAISEEFMVSKRPRILLQHNPCSGLAVARRSCESEKGTDDCKTFHTYSQSATRFAARLHPASSAFRSQFTILRSTPNGGGQARTCHVCQHLAQHY